MKLILAPLSFLYQTVLVRLNTLNSMEEQNIHQSTWVDLGSHQHNLESQEKKLLDYNLFTTQET